MYTTPAVAGDTVFVGSCAGVLYAFDASTGDIHWSYDVESELGGERVNFHGNPLILDDRIITGSDAVVGGNLFAVDRASGTAIWHLGSEQGFPTDLVQGDSNLYVVSSEDTLYCVSIEDGGIEWSFGAGPSLTDNHWPFSPASSDTLVYFGARDGSVYALDATSGGIIWHRDLEAAISTTLIADVQTIFAGAEDGRVHRLDQATGEVVASLDIGATPKWSPVRNGSVIAFLAEGDQEIIAVHDSLSTVLWSRPPGTSWTSYRPYEWYGLILAGESDGTLHALDPESGESEWTLKVGGTVRGIGSAGETILVGTLEGMVYALRLHAD